MLLLLEIWARLIQVYMVMQIHLLKLYADVLSSTNIIVSNVYILLQWHTSLVVVHFF